MKFPLPDKEYTVVVVMATFNHASFIEEAFKGILSQQVNFPITTLVLDDCSTDGTSEIIRKYESQYPSLFKGFFFDENQFSQGKGTIPFAYPWIGSSKYFALCEGDDYWTDPLKLQKQVDFMDNHPECTMSFHNAIEHWEDGCRPDALFSHIENREYSGAEIYENWIIPTASCMVNARIFQNNDLFNILGEKDFFLHDSVWFLCCGMCGKLYGIEDTMSVYRRNASGLSLKINTDAHRCLETIKKLCRHYRAMKTHFGGFYGERILTVCNKWYFNYHLRGMLLSLRLIDVASYGYFLKQGFSESISWSLKNQLRMLYHIVSSPIKMLRRNSH